MGLPKIVKFYINPESRCSEKKDEKVVLGFILSRLDIVWDQYREVRAEVGWGRWGVTLWIEKRCSIKEWPNLQLISPVERRPHHEPEMTVCICWWCKEGRGKSIGITLAAVVQESSMEQLMEMEVGPGSPRRNSALLGRGGVDLFGGGITWDFGALYFDVEADGMEDEGKGTLSLYWLRGE